MADFSDEVGAVSDQMSMMRMMGTASRSQSAASAPSASKTEAPAKPAKAAVPARRVKETLHFLGQTFDVYVSIPPAYDKPGHENDRFNCLYVLDREEKTFIRVAEAAVAAHAATAGIDGRQWYPELLVVTAYEVRDMTSAEAYNNAIKPSPEQLFALMASQLIGWVESKFRVEPFAAGRAVCGMAGEGSEAVICGLGDVEHAKMFQTYIIGAPEAESATKLSGGAPLADKTAVCLCPSEAQGAAAEACRTALQARAAGGDSMGTVMTVDRNGEQHYTKEARLGTAIDVLEPEGEVYVEGSLALVSRAIGWLGARLEKRKLERLGSVMPWHEFK